MSALVLNPWRANIFYGRNLSFKVQDGSPGHKAGLEAFFDFIVAIGNTRLVIETKEFLLFLL